jgi:hypothetical protein
MPSARKTPFLLVLGLLIYSPHWRLDSIAYAQQPRQAPTRPSATQAPTMNANRTTPSRPSVAATIPQTIEKLNRSQSQVGHGPNAPSCPPALTSATPAPKPSASVSRVFESLKSCRPERHYLEASIAKANPILLAADPPPMAELSRECVFSGMKNFVAAAAKETAPEFSKCPDPSGEPVRRAMKPCLTDNYVNVTHSSLIYVADCMGYPQKELFAKLTHESGLHINAYSGTGAGGIGQFTAVAIRDVNQSFEAEKKKVLSSKKASCRAIADQVAKMKPLPSSKKNRCELIAPPTNPLQSLMYSVISSRNNERVAENVLKKGYWQKNPESGRLEMITPPLEKKLSEKGLTLDKVQFQKMKSALAIIAYNGGAKTAAVLLNDYLDDKASVTRRDFAFYSSDANPYRKGKNKNASGASMTFPEYAVVAQSVGEGGYLSKIALDMKQIEKERGVGKCAPANYIDI